MKDKTTGEVIATPYFYQSANAFAGAWTIGSHDKSIPSRLAGLFEKYMKDNYSELVGGRTGRDK